MSEMYTKICHWENLRMAHHKASRGGGHYNGLRIKRMVEWWKESYFSETGRTYPVRVVLWEQDRLSEKAEGGARETLRLTHQASRGKRVAAAYACSPPITDPSRASWVSCYVGKYISAPRRSVIGGWVTDPVRASWVSCCAL
jgi:hypothetical protein